MSDTNQTTQIESNPDILGGLPCIAGTRIPVRAIWSFYEAGYNTEEIIREYPTLTPQQVAAAISYMRGSVQKTTDGAA